MVLRVHLFWKRDENNPFPVGTNMWKPVVVLVSKSKLHFVFSVRVHTPYFHLPCPCRIEENVFPVRTVFGSVIQHCLIGQLGFLPCMNVCRKNIKFSGNYYFEISNPTGDDVGVYATLDKVQPDAAVYFDRKPVGDEDEKIKKIKENAIKNLPHLPIDPIYKQDETIVLPTYKTRTFAEMIKQL